MHHVGGSGVGGSGGSDAWKEAPETVLEGNEDEEDEDDDPQTPAPTVEPTSAKKTSGGTRGQPALQRGGGSGVTVLKGKGHRGRGTLTGSTPGAAESTRAFSDNESPVHTLHTTPSGMVAFANQLRRPSAVGDPRSRTSSLGDASDDDNETQGRVRRVVVAARPGVARSHV